ncbi:glutamate--tRNA ligase, partial [Campylobacter lari]
MQEITTRFAPSPTGYLHIGGLRTALYNYLYARKNKGKFLLRIEDTDLKRNSQEATQAIIEAFKWCGLDYDGTIEYQSQRFDIYKKYIQKLLDEGKAYYCYMSKEELDELRAKQEAAKERPKYDGRYRDFKGTPPSGIEPVVRIKAPQSGEIKFIDGIKGEVSFKAEDILDDFVIARSDGSPIYNLTVVIDDALMGVSDVIRGDDHLSNTPKQIVLYEALGFKIPKFYHVAMIHGEDGKKLSKRHGATDVMEYKNMGILPQALLNFLVRLGWSHGDDEIFSLESMQELFDPNHINKSASCYNFKKLEWLNAHYIKTLPFEEINRQLKDLGFDLSQYEKAGFLLDMLRERAKTLHDIISGAKVLLNEPKEYDQKAVDKFLNVTNLTYLEKYAMVLNEQKNA